MLEQIRQVVEESGETPHTIAKGSGVDKGQLSRLLNRRRAISIETAERLLDYLGLEIVIQPKRRRKTIRKEG